MSPSMAKTNTTTMTRAPSLEILPAHSQDDSVSSLSLDESEQSLAVSSLAKKGSPRSKGILKTFKSKPKTPSQSPDHPVQQKPRALSRKRATMRGARSLSFKALSLPGSAAAALKNLGGSNHSLATSATCSTNDSASTSNIDEETTTSSMAEDASLASPDESSQPSLPSRRRRARPFLSRNFSGRSLSLILSSDSTKSNESNVSDESKSEPFELQHKKKSVSFDLPECTTHTIPFTTKSDVSSLYYTKHDYKKYAAQGQALADTATWKCVDKDLGTKRVQAVLVCSGVISPNEVFSSEQAALQYYFSKGLKVPDIFPSHNKKKYSSSESSSSSSSSSSTTILRGLERQMASPLADAKIQVTQNILDKARSTKDMNELALYAAKQTSKARRFARLLGKADAAILGLSTSCSKKKASI